MNEIAYPAQALPFDSPADAETGFAAAVVVAEADAVPAGSQRDNARSFGPVFAAHGFDHVFAVHGDGGVPRRIGLELVETVRRCIEKTVESDRERPFQVSDPGELL